MNNGRPAGNNRDLLVRKINSQSDDLFGAQNRALLSLGDEFLARRSEPVVLRRSKIKFLGDSSLRVVKICGFRCFLDFCPIQRQTPKPEPLCCRSVSDIIKAAVINTRG